MRSRFHVFSALLYAFRNSFYMTVKDEADLKSKDVEIRQPILEIIGLNILWTDIMAALRCPNEKANWPAVTDW